MISTLGRSYQFCENQHLLMAKHKKWGLTENKSVAALSKHARQTNSGMALAYGSAAAQESTRWGCPGRRERGLLRTQQNGDSVRQGTDHQEIISPSAHRINLLLGLW